MAVTELPPDSAPLLPKPVLEAVWAGLPDLADETVGAILASAPAWAEMPGDQIRPIVESVTHDILTGIARRAADGIDAENSSVMRSLEENAVKLGRLEGRLGRPPEMLLGAYRIGARTVWRKWSALALQQNVPGAQLTAFTELIFSVMDRLSAAAVTGNADEQARTGLARRRHLDELTRLLLSGAPADVLIGAASRAQWEPPKTLTAMAITQGHRLASGLAPDPRTLDVPYDVSEAAAHDVGFVLIPDLTESTRDQMVRRASVPGVVGPIRPWMQVASSWRRVQRVLTFPREEDVIADTEQFLSQIVLSADPEALADLRASVLSPLQDLRPAVRDKLVETLCAWLQFHGRRADIAAALYLHPQTVRYRVAQLRTFYGDKLTDPRHVTDLTIALSAQSMAMFGSGGAHA